LPALKLKSALLCAFVALQVADVLTTNSFLAHASAVEGNPLMADAQASLGSWWWLAKLALVAGVTPILAPGRTRYAAAMVVLYGVTVVNNAML
jgi:Domain of unknown function (DUF5658)